MNAIPMLVACFTHQALYYVHSCECGEAMKTLGHEVCATCAVRAEIALIERRGW